MCQYDESIHSVKLLWVCIAKKGRDLENINPTKTNIKEVSLDKQFN